MKLKKRNDNYRNARREKISVGIHPSFQRMMDQVAPWVTETQIAVNPATAELRAAIAAVIAGEALTAEQEKWIFAFQVLPCNRAKMEARMRDCNQLQ